MTHQCIDRDEGVSTIRKNKHVKSKTMGKDMTRYVVHQEIRGGEDAVQFKIQQ